MRIKILGAAAGGGFPQWNCGCPNCQRVRTGDPTLRPRMNNSLAISDDGGEWYLINATPDVCAQIESYSALQPQPAHSMRHSPILGILLTDAELDHTIGLLNLRQSAELDIYATAPVLQALSTDFPVQNMLEPYAQFQWIEILPKESFPLFGGKLEVYPFVIGRKPPRYASMSFDYDNRETFDSWGVGYRILDHLTQGVLVYAPGIEVWTVELEKQLTDADCILFDGTFWDIDELRSLDVSDLKSYDMGHIPIGGEDGSLIRLAKQTARHKIYTHINNTNPILNHSTIQYHQLKESGIEIGYDGLELEV